MLPQARNGSQSKDDLFIYRLKKKQLAQLTSTKKKLSHTYEFQGKLVHDRNFNNIEKTVQESWAAAVILRNAPVFGETIYILCAKFAKIWLKNNGSEAFNFFAKEVEENVDATGQFARVFKQDITSNLLSSEYSAEIFAKKILLVKAMGEFIINHAINDAGKYTFLFKDNVPPVAKIVQRNRPDSLFTVRGRSGVMSNTYREDIGILDQAVFSQLDPKLQKILTINGLTKNRPLFRTRISHKLADGSPAFVERMFDRDNPLLASISGSTACLFTAADVLDDTLSQSQLDQITLSAIALFVGGGYHSVHEIINIRSPHLNIMASIESQMRLKNRGAELQEYVAALHASHVLLR